MHADYNSTRDCICVTKMTIISFYHKLFNDIDWAFTDSISMALTNKECWHKMLIPQRINVKVSL